MYRTDLARIAAAMKADLATRPTVERALGRLLLRLRRNDARLILDIARSDIIPDPYDAEIIAHAFGVDCYDPRPVKFTISDSDGCHVTVKGVQVSWVETAL